MLASLALVALPGGAENLHDPTRPSAIQAGAVTRQKHAGELTLSAIWLSGSGKYATINGTTARQGETIFGDITITSIQEHSVRISRNGLEQRLKLISQEMIKR